MRCSTLEPRPSVKTGGCSTTISASSASRAARSDAKPFCSAHTSSYGADPSCRRPQPRRGEVEEEGTAAEGAGVAGEGEAGEAVEGAVSEAAVDEAGVNEADVEQNRRPRIDGQNGARQVIKWGARKDRAGRRTCSIIVLENSCVTARGSSSSRARSDAASKTDTPVALTAWLTFGLSFCLRQLCSQPFPPMHSTRPALGIRGFQAWAARTAGPGL